MSRSGDDLLKEVSRLHRGRTAGIILITALAAGAGLLLPGALAAAVNAAIGGHLSWPRVTWVLALGLVEILADVVGGVLTVRATSVATAWLRRRLVDHLLALGIRSRFADGDALSRLTGDCANAGAVSSILIQLGTSGLISAGAVALLVLLDPRLAIVFLASLPVAMFIARSHLRHSADDILAYQQVSGDISARLLDAVRGLRTIAASGTADRETARVLRPLPQLGEAGAGMWRTQARMVWRAALLLPAVELAVLAAAGLGVLDGRLTIGDMLAALGYVALGMSLVRGIPLLTTLTRARSCAHRIAEALAEPTRSRGKLLGPLGPGTIATDDITIPGGAFVAVVGRSGSGKSTLVAQLGGLTRAGVRLDGMPLERIRPEELCTLIAYAFERPGLIGHTVADAVGYGTWSGRAAVRDACRAAQVHDLVVRLPDGYDTPLAEAPLSGGEAQRVGLARALVRRPRVLILDDATASLDTVTESLVDNAISGFGCTRIVVTHRQVTAARADLVLWLESGRIRAMAPHERLWRNPEYRAVFE